MKFLPLIWRNLWRRKVRTIFTLLSIFVAFLLFGLLMTIRASFSLRRRARRRRPADVIHKTGLIMPLPVWYQITAAGGPGRRSGYAQHLVWRHLSGSQELFCSGRHRARHRI